MCLALSSHGGAQESRYAQIRAHNAAMTAVQPSWMGPLMQSDARLAQGLKISVSQAHAPGAQIISYGNNHGMSLLGGTRWQFDMNPPSFFRNHSPALPDGFGNAGAQVKYRIASGNAQHGNYALSAIAYQGFARGAQENGLLSSFYCPKIAVGKAWGRFALIDGLGGVLPTEKIYAQGRAIEWNTTAQVHAGSNAWIDIEENATFFRGGPNDGMVQNFLTPAAFVRLRLGHWPGEHTAFVFGGGMQIATTRFHLYDHNSVTELRLLF